MRKIEKLLFVVILILTIFSAVFLFLPQKAETGTLICGVAHPEDPEYCAFTYESNCCVIVEQE